MDDRKRFDQIFKEFGFDGVKSLAKELGYMFWHIGDHITVADKKGKIVFVHKKEVENERIFGEL